MQEELERLRARNFELESNNRLLFKQLQLEKKNVQELKKQLKEALNEPPKGAQKNIFEEEK